MAIRVLFLLLGFIIAVNIVIIGVGLIFNVNLYQKYGKQILVFFAGFAVLIVAIYTTLAILGLV